MSKKLLLVFATCDAQGFFTGLMILDEFKIRVQSSKTNEDEIYHLEWEEKGETKSTHFLEGIHIELENILTINYIQ